MKKETRIINGALIRSPAYAYYAALGVSMSGITVNVKSAADYATKITTGTAAPAANAARCGMRNMTIMIVAVINAVRCSIVHAITGNPMTGMAL
jgi:hypothetical protein